MALSTLLEIATHRRTLIKWRTEIRAYFGTGLTNGRTEGFNNKAKVARRRAFSNREGEVFMRWTLRVALCAAASCSAAPEGKGADLVTCESEVATLETRVTALEDERTTLAAEVSACEADLGIVQASRAACDTSLTTCSVERTACATDLFTCAVDRDTCGSERAACGGDLTTCETDLTACGTDLAACGNNLATCSDDFDACDQRRRHQSQAFAALATAPATAVRYAKLARASKTTG
jgi:hypothetical protein